METKTTNCLACTKPLRGRIDKKFCDDFCRNSYNNRQNSDSNAYIRSINQFLKKNRRIMETLLPHEEEKVTLSKEKLREKGFQFKYLTHTYTTKQGNIYHYCYEYGYLPLDNDRVLLVRRSENSY